MTLGSNGDPSTDTIRARGEEVIKVTSEAWGIVNMTGEAAIKNLFTAAGKGEKTKTDETDGGDEDNTSFQLYANQARALANSRLPIISGVEN